MTLKWIEGFETLSPPSLGSDMVDTDLADKYIVSSISGTRLTPGRDGVASQSWCWAVYTTNSYIETKALADHASWVVGLAIRFTSFTQHNFLECYDGATLQLAVRSNTDGTLSVLRGTTVLGTTTAQMSSGTWYYVEFKFTINNTTGSFALRWAATVPAQLSQSSIDTQEGSNANVDRFRFKLYDEYLDDIYILTQEGAVNDVLAFDASGLYVEGLDLTADGTYTDWTSSLGTSWQALANQTYTTQDDNYVRSDTPNDVVSLVQSNPSVTISHVGMQMNIRCRNLNTNDQHQLTPMYRYSAADTYLTSQTATIDWASNVHEVVTGVVEAGTALINDAEVGARLET